MTRPTKSRAPTDVAVVRLSGSVGREGLETADWMVRRAADDGQPNALVDLSEAEHVDYRAVTILVARRRYLKAKGGELAVAAGKRAVRDILRVSAGLELKVFVTVDEATAYLSGALAVARPAAARARAR